MGGQRAGGPILCAKRGAAVGGALLACFSLPDLVTDPSSPPALPSVLSHPPTPQTTRPQKDGGLTTNFWISLLLIFFGFFPSSIFAAWHVFFRK